MSEPLLPGALDPSRASAADRSNGPPRRSPRAAIPQADYSSADYAVVTLPDKGRGVFARVPLAAGRVVMVDPTKRFDGPTVAAIGNGWIQDLLFVDPLMYGKVEPCDRLLVIGLISICNHAEEPNCRVAWHVAEGYDWAALETLRRIEVGEELLVSYTNIDEYRDAHTFV